MTDNSLIFTDLHSQYKKIEGEIKPELEKVLESCAFIHGAQVVDFEHNLEAYLNVKHVISCANGTDALQIALMALGLKRGDEVLVPAFTYVATAEVIGLLGLTPVLLDVDLTTFNLFGALSEAVKKCITPKTKAIVPVHLFGQCADMEAVMAIAREYGLRVVEDTAQALGAKCKINGRELFAGTIGDVGCTSFFPTKNLGCYGDGGALFTDNEALASKLRMIASHGQEKKYYHKVIGCNSRLDTLQAAVLNVKLRHLNDYLSARYKAAQYYTEALKQLDPVERFFVTPAETAYSTHTYHQYTLVIKGEKRDALKAFLQERGIPTMIYYPLPLQAQEAFESLAVTSRCSLDNAAYLAGHVLSLPMHTELFEAQQDTVVGAIKEFYNL